MVCGGGHGPHDLDLRPPYRSLCAGAGARPALPAPVEWLRRAERPLMLFAAICAMAAISYNVDLFLFGRFVDRNLTPGVIDAAAAPAPWPSKRPEAQRGPHPLQICGGRGLCARRRHAHLRLVSGDVSPSTASSAPTAKPCCSILWGAAPSGLPFTCLSVAEALDHARDAQDRMFLTFLSGITARADGTPGAIAWAKSKRQCAMQGCRSCEFLPFRPGLSARRRDAARLAPYDRAQERSQEARRHYQRPELFGPLFFTSPTRPRLSASLLAVAILDRRHQTGLPDYGLFSCHRSCPPDMRNCRELAGRLRTYPAPTDKAHLLRPARDDDGQSRTHRKHP